MTRPKLAPGTWGEINPRSLPDGGFEVRVQYRRLDGTSQRIKARGNSKSSCRAAALAKLSVLVAEHSTGPDVSPDMSFSALAQMWITELRLNSVEPGDTHEEERLINKQLIPRLGAYTMRELRPSTIDRAYKEMHAKTPGQARNAMVPLRKIMQLGVRLDAIAASPVRDIALVKRKKGTIFAPEPMQLDELRDHIVAYRNNPDRPGPKVSNLLEHVVEVILGSSCRIGEAVGLRWQDVDLVSDPPTITIAGSVAEGRGQPKRWKPSTKTESGYRTVPIPDHLVAILLERALESDGNEFVFHTRTGQPNGQQDVHRALQRVRAFAGISSEMVPHALRKSVATAIANTGGLSAAAKTLGHKESRVTETYYAKHAQLAPDMRLALDSLAPGASRGRE